MVNINEIIEEVQFRTKEGIVDWSNKEHISLLAEVLIELGYESIANEWIKNLTEADDNSNSEEDKYVHIGGSAYVRANDYDDSKETAKDGAQHYKKNDSGTFVPMSDAEYEKEKEAQGDAGKDAPQPNAEDGGDDVENTSEKEQQQNVRDTFSDPDYQSKIDREEKAAEEARKAYEESLPDNNKITSNIDDSDVKTLRRVQKRINGILPSLDKKERTIAKKCFAETATLFRDDISTTDKVKLAAEIRSKYKITTNAAQTKYYINVLGKNRKIFGDNSKSAARMVKEIKKYTQIDQVNLSQMKKNLTAAAKPDFGKEFEVNPSEDSRVKQLFSTSPLLSRIRESIQGVFAPKDENGNILFPSSEHTADYLKQSFENPALQKTINMAEDFVNKDQLPKSYLTGLKDHQTRLSTLLQNYKSPSDELASAIGESYNKLMVDLNEADPEAAASVMKQLAENRLYETELAKGKEVYLPSSGTFPGGDIIERDGSVGSVALVSCKFGKTGRIYGCPANMKAVTVLHPDESKREIFGQYVGEKGHILMVKDELFVGNSREETTENINKLISNSLINQKLGNVFSQDELKELAEITSNYYTKVKELRNELETKYPKIKADQFWGKFQEGLKKFKGEFGSKVQNIATQDKMNEIAGEQNSKNFKSRMTPDVFFSTVLLCENIRTSGGYGLEHNKQYYDENNMPKYVTSKGTTEPNDYSLTIRNERTFGRSGGGIQLSFSGEDGERPVGQLQ